MRRLRLGRKVRVNFEEGGGGAGVILGRLALSISIVLYLVVEE